MANTFIKYPNYNGVQPYPTFSAFPATAGDGAIAIAQDTNTLYSYDTTGAAWVVIAGSSGVLSIGTLDSQTASANGAVIAVNALVLQSASATRPGLINNTTQTISGNKTLTGTIAASNLSGTNTGDQNISNLVTGPASATDTALARFDLLTGKLIQNSSVTLNALGALTAVSTPAGAAGITLYFTAGTPQPNNSDNGGDLVFTPGSAAQDGGGGQPGQITFNGGLDSDGNPTASIINVGLLTAYSITATNGGFITGGFTADSATVSASLTVPQGTRSERFGASASANGTDTVSVGSLATANFNNAVALGATATVTGDSGTAVGFGSASGAQGTSVGRGANSTGGDIAAGYGAISSALRSSAIGKSSQSTADAGLAIGTQSNIGHQASIGIGYQSTSTAANQLILGGVSSRSIKNVFIGAGVVDATPDPTVTVQPTGGLGADIVGSSLIIAGGVSTGAGAPSSIAFQTTTVAGSSSTPQTLTTRLTISSTAITSTLPLTLPAGTAAAFSVSAEQNLGTLAWTAGVAPSGTINKKYHWTQVGKQVTLWCKIDASVAGTAVSAVDFPLPGDLPAPATFASQPASTVITYGSGNLSTTANAALNGASDSKLYLDGGSAARVTIETTVAVAGAFAWATFSYLTS